ncbi:50S ribosomal protein L30 [Candidatus Formimonas warabiya]|uniref:50S ribosomal protein L30 n=1 Tax=Formimonas warabiya TaxID=1761012 RepID=UPI0011D08309|nr:50S ribosomal protein L30 [Candidatus Formimonas warabiya]
MAKQLKITLVKSLIGYEKSQRETVKSLGLGKLNSWAIQKDTPDIRGKINTVPHLVRVEEIEA